MAVPAPHFYNVTLQPPQVITAVTTGCFAGLAKTQEICVARGTRLELLRPDPATGRVETVLEHDVFGTVRSLTSFRLTGASKGALPSACGTFLRRLRLAALASLAADVAFLCPLPTPPC